MKNLEDEIYFGAWKCLCAGVLLQAVQRIRSERRMHAPGSTYRIKGTGGLDKELLHQRSGARDWIEGGVGVITFEDCCDSVGVDPAEARKKIEEYCHGKKVGRGTDSLFDYRRRA